MASEPGETVAARSTHSTRRTAAHEETARANRSWWDDAADWYLDEHGSFLGDTGFVWCPEGLSEDEAQLLGDVAGRAVLEAKAVRPAPRGVGTAHPPPL